MTTPANNFTDLVLKRSREFADDVNELEMQQREMTERLERHKLLGKIQESMANKVAEYCKRSKEERMNLNRDDIEINSVQAFLEALVSTIKRRKTSSSTSTSSS
jgi:hypothetical protein